MSKHMKLEQLFTKEELSLIDSGKYRPGRAVLDAKLDLWAAFDREAFVITGFNACVNPDEAVRVRDAIAKAEGK